MHYIGEITTQRRTMDNIGPSGSAGDAAIWSNAWEILDWRLDATDRPPFPYNDWHFQILFLKLLKRNVRLIDPSMDVQVARLAYEEALARGHIDSLTHRLLWLACQRDPRREYLEQYIRILDADASTAANTLRAKLASLS